MAKAFGSDPMGTYMAAKNPAKVPTIVLIEESADKAMLVKEAFVEVSPKIIEVVEITKPVIKQQSKAIAIALFLAAPFIGLLYALALPFVGLAMLAMIGGKAFAKTRLFQGMWRN